MALDETRKGPWTEQEDLQLVGFVGLFGNRRWDFIAKVSGLNRTGKSCRLRWVNYLHPGLKQGKMTPHEERLVLELHSKWGNRWSRIARKLPGRTDNEIKNYWRTHMRKKTQERKLAVCPSSSSSNCSSSLLTDPKVDMLPFPHTGEVSFYDTGGNVTPTSTRKKSEKEEKSEKVYSMDDIWKDIDISDESTNISVYDDYKEAGCSFTCPPMVSPTWEYSPDWLWRMEEEEDSKVFLPISDQFSFYCEHERASITG